ncbi:MAG: hypothetical protein QME16_06310, partial [Planctomycetota bacterium]|nr:hypothetical protein [Planctomycetota bacterium]
GGSWGGCSFLERSFYMIKRIILIALLLGAVSGCIGYNLQWEPSWVDGFEHEKRHFRAWQQDMSAIHKFIDKHLFNLDEEDPTRY